MNYYKTIFGAFNDGGVRYIIVGGVAMNFIGRERFTNDIDVLLALNEENLKRMSIVMKKLGYEQRLPLALEELGDEKTVLKLMKEKHLMAYTFVHPVYHEFNVDVIAGDSLHFSEYEKRCTYLSLWNIKIPVIAIDDLIAMKKKAGRKKDIDDVDHLLQFKGL